MKDKWYTWVLTAILLSVLSNALTPHDDTDPPSGRSGLSIYRDNLTGCEYLSNGIFITGGLTPRIDAQGKPICLKGVAR